MLFYLWPACLIDYARAPVIIDSFFFVADSNPRLVTAYLSSIFSLPITASSGERLTHEEVVARLDDDQQRYLVRASRIWERLTRLTIALLRNHLKLQSDHLNLSLQL